ncbi:hypothetical protein Ngar_c08570 [Candidatus Nitrososphaera gargensis Ga9.2]|uniref:Uncharacterized protein n=1 Tax=Nitrososphaera gargensis (strain Ga9.2) TaxID=1237085 RepID=K0IMD0_NITGG|nr:hypothetical protein Ngar_c08570 [Candidatus Nitrososphaera gargensis Ga9.2]
MGRVRRGNKSSEKRDHALHHATHRQFGEEPRPDHYHMRMKIQMIFTEKTESQ